MSEAPAKSVDLHDLVGAEVTLVDFGLPTSIQCARCGAQAYVEIEVHDKPVNRVFELCAHHYSEHENKLRETACRIVDHRPYLAILEKVTKGIDSR